MSLAYLGSAARRAPAWTVIVATVCAIAFSGLAILVAAGATRDLDLATVHAFQSVASYPLDVAVNIHTIFGQAAVTVPMCIGLAIIAQRRFGSYAWVAPMLLLATVSIETVFKYLIDTPPHPHELVRALWNPLSIPREIQPPNSFPSGHVTRISFVSMMAAGIYPSRGAYAAAIAVMAASVFARVYIGDHWISDAIAGVAVGAGVGAVGVAWMRATGRR